VSVRIITGHVLDSLAALPDESVHCVVTDPPYAQTSLAWDRWPTGWLEQVRRVLHPTGSMWAFGTLRMFMDRG
jgi:site-specific DNA-methyltransferase (adenine-specific)